MSIDLKPRLDGVQIVVRGSLNPAILHPEWLVRRELLGEQEAATAEVKIVSREVTQFTLDWLTLQVTPDYLSCESSDPSRYLPLKELVEGIFAFLEHTPVTRLGLNRRMHFKVSTEDTWHELGDRWAPKEPWAAFLMSARSDGLPGLRSLTMEGTREGSSAKYLRVKVEPSVRVQPGIYIETNEHYELDEKERAPLELMSEILASAWAPAQDFALTIARHLLADGSK